MRKRLCRLIAVLALMVAACLARGFVATGLAETFAIEAIGATINLPGGWELDDEYPPEDVDQPYYESRRVFFATNETGEMFCCFAIHADKRAVSSPHAKDLDRRGEPELLNFVNNMREKSQHVTIVNLADTIAICYTNCAEEQLVYRAYVVYDEYALYVKEWRSQGEALNESAYKDFQNTVSTLDFVEDSPTLPDDAPSLNGRSAAESSDDAWMRPLHPAPILGGVPYVIDAIGATILLPPEWKEDNWYQTERENANGRLNVFAATKENSVNAPLLLVSRGIKPVDPPHSEDFDRTPRSVLENFLEMCEQEAGSYAVGMLRTRDTLAIYQAYDISSTSRTKTQYMAWIIYGDLSVAITMETISPFDNAEFEAFQSIVASLEFMENAKPLPDAIARETPDIPAQEFESLQNNMASIASGSIPPAGVPPPARGKRRIPSPIPLKPSTRPSPCPPSGRRKAGISPWRKMPMGNGWYSAPVGQPTQGSPCYTSREPSTP